MNYEIDNKLWRIGSPLFAFFAIRFTVETFFYVFVSCTQLKKYNITAAFNGLQYMDDYGQKMLSYSHIISIVAMIITLPVLYLMIKKDYEYPVNPRKKEKSFSVKEYTKRVRGKTLVYPSIAGIAASMGIGRFIMMLPFDGILGDYSQVQKINEQTPIIVQFIAMGLLAPMVEELLFRGLVYKRLKMYYDVTVAAYISALIFGISHMNLLQGIYGFIMGMFFAYIYEKYGNIYNVIVMHMAVNVTSVIMGINPISKSIDSFIVTRIIVAVAMIAVFVVMIIKISNNNKEPKVTVTIDEKI